MAKKDHFGHWNWSADGKNVLRMYCTVGIAMFVQTPYGRARCLWALPQAIPFCLDVHSVAAFFVVLGKGSIQGGMTLTQSNVSRTNLCMHLGVTEVESCHQFSRRSMPPLGSPASHHALYPFCAGAFHHPSRFWQFRGWQFGHSLWHPCGTCGLPLKSKPVAVSKFCFRWGCGALVCTFVVSGATLGKENAVKKHIWYMYICINACNSTHILRV